MDAQEFLGLEQVDDPLHWRLTVTPQLSTPGNFLFGGCGLGAGIEALEVASGRPVVWATAQYLSYAVTGTVVDYEVTLAVTGGHITQGRAVARCEGKEILTINAALGIPGMDIREVWVEPPTVDPPDKCPKRVLPVQFSDTILDRIDVRVAKGRGFENLEGEPGEPCSAVWARIPGHVEPTAATLGIFGDYVSGGVSQPLGRRTLGRSLDNTIRIAHVVPTEWVLVDISMHALIDGYAQGVAFLWSETGTLMATGSQSLSVRYWPDDLGVHPKVV